MIIPKVGEDVWREALAHLPPWTPPLQHTVILAPHPDDETLGAGGLIACLREHNVPIDVIAVTDGENCYAGEDPREQRVLEQTQALQRLGVEADRVHRLQLADSGLHRCEDELVRRLRHLISSGTHIIAPWAYDFHPDHEVCGRAAAAVAQEQKLQLTYYLFWTWHRGQPEVLAGVNPVRLSLKAEQQLAKKEALAFHRTQLVHKSGEPILPSYLLQPVWRDFEVFIPA